VISSPLLLGDEGGYQISRSVRIRQSASAYLNRTPASATNRKTWTWSGWVKIGKAASTGLFTASTSGSNMYTIQLGVGGDLNVYAYTGTYPYFRYTSAVFRDYSAWYHFVVAFDSTQATDTNRIKIYVNGVLQATTSGSGSGWPTLNYDGGINNTINHQFSDNVGGASYFDGYLTEVNFIDGQALTPSSFGETNAVTGVWQPKKYAGTYGTNGFYLNFSDNSNNTAATIGKDNSGNGNNWTPNNISVTAGATYDSMIDVPTLYADGGNGRGNYCTWSPLGTQIATYTTSITNGNLTASYNAATNVARINGTLGVSSGKWYFEFQSTAGDPMIGFATTNGANAYVYDGNAANKRNYAPITSGSPTSAAYGATWNTTNIIGVALDLDAGTLVFYKDNVSQGTAYTSLSGTFTPIFGFQGGTTVTGVGNFGQRPFTYTPPTGFVALNTQNLPDATIKNGASYMAATTYTGTGSALTIANTVGSASFQPDLVWVKGRSGATDHAWYDAVRGVQLQIESNNTSAETTETTGLTAFGTTGFTIGALAQMNTSAATYVAWQWKEGATQGFDIVTYTGTGVARTVSHSLNAIPAMVITWARSAAQGNAVWHKGLTGNGYYIQTSTTAAQANTPTNVWNGDINPTSTTFTVGSNGSTNANGTTYVAYVFSEVAGYSAFGKYTGNGSTDGPFVFLGFRPRWIMIKASSAARGWIMFDTARDPYNVSQYRLFANTSDAESSGTTANNIDILSNGFKLRLGANSEPSNESGTTYIYMAFAENPFKLSLAR
jgi:hypothetical protein